MYDIIRLFKSIFHKFPPKFWLLILGVLSLFFMCGLITSTISNLIDPPAPTATPRPTPDINQAGVSGEPIRVLDTFITVIGYDEFDSECGQIQESTHQETTKGVVLELWIRHLGKEPVSFSSFYLTDELGTNYALQAGEYVSRRQNYCLEPLSTAVSRASVSFSLTEGYGSHIYLYSFDVPADKQDLRLSFQMDYSIPYEAAGTTTTGSSKIFIGLQNKGLFADPEQSLLGPPTRQNLSVDRTTMIGDIAFAIRDINRVSGDNGNTYYYIELLINNTSNEIQSIRYESDLEFTVIDAYGVVLPAGLSLNTGYNHSISPGETQKYFLTWQMEQTSVRPQELYLRVLWKNHDQEYYFLQIPFKQSMLVSTAIPTAISAPVNAAASSTQETIQATAASQCHNTLPPRLKAGDTASVTYSPPVANRLREEAGFTGHVITLIQPGNVFYVIDGPICKDELYWYYVNFNGYYGWTAESDQGEYWLESR